MLGATGRRGSWGRRWDYREARELGTTGTRRLQGHGAGAEDGAGHGAGAEDDDYRDGAGHGDYRHGDYRDGAGHGEKSWEAAARQRI